MIIKKTTILFIFAFLFFLFVTLPKDDGLLSTFRMTNQPDVITKGTYGTAMTVNISYGKEDVFQWLESLQAPFPFIFADIDWLERSPKAVEILKQKKIPIGLLGKEGISYEEDPQLLEKEIVNYEKLFGKKPLWFRTVDEEFPDSLRNSLFQHEINALGSSVFWSAPEQKPKLKKGDILSIPYHRDGNIPLKSIESLRESHEFHSVEDVIFGVSLKTKKYPQ